MPLTALGLLVVAAMMHTTWNLLVKRAKEKQVFIWCSLIAGVIIFSPLLFTSSLFLLSTWPYLLSSALVEAIYYITLIRAYENGDFSLVYPMARGAAPAFLLIWATFFLGERPRFFGLIGIALLVLGLIIVGGKTWWTLRKTSGLSKSALALALGVACCISVYTAIDGAAVHHVSPLPYTVLVIALSVLFITPAVVMRYGNTAIVDELRTNWIGITIVGLFTLLAYILALKAYTIARVSYAGSVREISVVFAAFVGWRWLGESFGKIRLTGAMFIFAGILVIALAG
ncbi:MAG TPA: DMT family transporter [Ktedonobacteraceae bacterium]|nr:DMT family transporter [Ktedonobacteraceae bacterium]